VGNEFLHEMDIDLRIFNVELGNERFFKVCFTGSKISKLHPFEEKKVREKFEELSHISKKDLFKLYHEKEKSGLFKMEYTRDMESMPAEPESKIQRQGKIAVEHRSRYALAAWLLEEIANLREIKKIAEDIEEPLRTLILSQPDEMTREQFQSN
jgi:hypothetical protein